MTVTYSLDVATSSYFTQMKVLLRWKLAISSAGVSDRSRVRTYTIHEGSVWKAVAVELLVWLCMYFSLSLIYRNLLNKKQRETFENVCNFIDTFSVFIPVTFMLGFYLSAVYTRWNKVFDNLAWVDTSALTVAQYIRGTNERVRLIRRNIVRYMIVAQAMVLRDVSPAVRRRFPTMQHFVTSGLMTEAEMVEYNAVSSPQAKYWQPIQWLFCNATTALDEGYIGDTFLYIDLVEKVRQFRAKILALAVMDMVPVPLVYTQVVNMAVRFYFFLALFGRQFLDTNNPDVKYKIDLYFPVFTSLQILFIVGWLKAAEVMLNPLGEDDEDFETNWMIDRNLQVGYAIVDQAYGRCPEIARDSFWEEEQPQPLYTPAAAERRHNPIQGSCVGIDFESNDDGFLSRIRKRPHRLSDAESVDSVATVPTFVTHITNSYMPSGESETSLRRGKGRLSDVFDKYVLERRNSVCLAALNLNRMREKADQCESQPGEHLPAISNSNGDCLQVKIGKSYTSPQVSVDVSKSAAQVDAPQTAPRKLPVTWYVDELPVIHEEDAHRGSDRDIASLASNSLHSITSPSLRAESRSVANIEDDKKKD